MNGWAGKAYYISEWIMKMAYVNILWVIFSLLGLLFFGLFPATTAMFSVTRKWVMGEKDIPIFKTFWKAYRMNFFQANVMGLILVVLGVGLYFDLTFANVYKHHFIHNFKFLFIILLFVYLVLILYIFPVYSHYKFKTLGYIKYSLIMAIARPIQTIAMIAGSAVVYFLSKYYPGLIPFLSGSTLSLVLMWLASRSFPKMAE